jgi:homopolymeric O-antigen transport system ATP-binding protein
MSDTVIKVSNLSKKYLISHQQKERYTALRDVLTNKAKSIGQRVLSPFSRSELSAPGPSLEEFYALKDINVEIKRGERVGIIGRNGAGKSTLLKVLSRITEPSKGRIEITGRVASLLEVGTGFHPELTGRENIFLNGAILGMTKAEIKKKFDEIVAFAEVEKFLDTPVKRYSSGMYVRLAFAVAAHLEPEILIVDEVLSVGDAQFQKKCLGKMEEVGKEGRTILFVSHNMGSVDTLCNAGILLTSGEIEYQGDAVEAVKKYVANGDHGNVITNIKYFNEKVRVTSTEINGSGDTNIHLAADENFINVVISGISLKKSKVSIEAKMYDIRGNVIAIYSPGHIDLNVLEIDAGGFVITATIILPPMTKGEYYFDLYLLNPGYEFYCLISSAVTIIKESAPVRSRSGGVFESRLGHGSILLGGGVKLGNGVSESEREAI